MKKLKIAFLINPVSGGGQGLKAYTLLPQILKKFSLHPDQYLVEFTRPGETVSQATRLVNEAEKLIAVGGDGTALESITGVYFSGSKVPLGLIPLGTGNDLARALQLYEVFKHERIEGCLRCFLKGTVVPFDIWRVNRKELMINYLSIGLDAVIVSSFHIHRTRGKISFNSVLFNRLAYAIIGISRIFCKIRGNLKLKFWSEDETRVVSLKSHRLVILSNIPFYAGGTLLAPQANFSDGFLEITPFPRAIHLIGLFAFQRNLWFRKWYGNRLTHFQANRIEIDVPNGNYLQIDGEDKTFLLNSKKVEIEYGGQISLLKGN